MQCPVCKTRRLERQILDDHLVTHVCNDCMGQYIRSNDYFQWLNRHGQILPEKPRDQQADLPVSDSKPGKLCPECGAFLILHKVGHEIDFHIERCARCAGIWFDENEWEILKSRNLHDEVHFIFSEAWQSQVKKEQRKQEYNQVVTRILDGKLGEQMSNQDLDKLREFKDWLDDHPLSSQLYAYLTSTRDQ